MADRRRLRQRPVVTGSVVVVVLAGAAGGAYAATSGSGPSYRFATVSRGSVTQTLPATGTLEPMHSADVDFQVAGTVGKVFVKQGQHITQGQRLARLAESSLRLALSGAEEALTRDQATLSDAESGESTAASGQGSGATSAISSGATSSGAMSSVSTTALDTEIVTASTPLASASAAPSAPSATASRAPQPNPSTSPSTGAGAGTPINPAITRDQSAVVATQHQLDLDLATAKTALTAEKNACAAELAGGSGTTSLAACTTAATTLLADQQTVAADETAVEKAELSLTQALSAAIAALHTPASTSTGSHHGTPTRTTTGSRSTTSHSSATTETVSAATLASDEAAIDTARASVASSRSDLAQAVIRAPISGTVAAVTVAKGDSASGSSSTTDPAVIIRGSHQAKVVTDLTAAQVRQVRTGLVAAVVPDGASSPLRGHVISIGLTATSGNGSSGASTTSTYPVSVELDDASGVVAGADATVTITLATVRNVTTVPTSALHQSGSAYTVRVLQAGRVRSQRVTVGVTGAALTQIRSGLSVGARVVLADLAQKVPSSSTNQTTNRRSGFRGTGGGPPGGGFGGGALGGGAAGGFGNR